MLLKYNPEAKVQFQAKPSKLENVCRGFRVSQHIHCVCKKTFQTPSPEIAVQVSRSLELRRRSYILLLLSDQRQRGDVRKFGNS